MYRGVMCVCIVTTAAYVSRQSSSTPVHSGETNQSPSFRHLWKRGRWGIIVYCFVVFCSVLLCSVVLCYLMGVAW
jgi:ABC-type Fe3+ transport system permease subunit